MGLEEEDEGLGPWVLEGGGEKSSNGGIDVLSGLALLRILYTFWERTWGYCPE